jgi:hypothetical protein
MAAHVEVDAGTIVQDGTTPCVGRTTTDFATNEKKAATSSVLGHQYYRLCAEVWYGPTGTAQLGAAGG